MKLSKQSTKIALLGAGLVSGFLVACLHKCNKKNKKARIASHDECCCCEECIFGDGDLCLKEKDQLNNI